MKNNKFAFKTNKPATSFENATVDIKLDKMLVGYIYVKNGYYKINISVIKDDNNEDDNINCDWKWVQFKYNGVSFDETKIWLNENIDYIISNFNLKLR